MKKEAVWLVGGGPMQYIIAKKIISFGFSLIVSDKNQNAVCASISNLFLVLDTFDVESHLSACNEVIEKFEVSAVLTFAADCHYTVARLARHLGLHGIDPEISKICRNKIKTRQILKSAGVYQPDSYLVSSYEETLNILCHYPEKRFVLKASDNSGSRGFQVISDRLLFSINQFEYTRKYCHSGNLILEEQLIADPKQISEASVETIWLNGQMYWLNWVDRIFSCDLKFFPMIKFPFLVADGIEVGHINPAKRDFSLKMELFELIKKAGCALGMDKQVGGHLLKADIFFSINGPVILELTPRSSGGWDSSGSSPARCVDIAGGVIYMALGKSVDLNAWNSYFHYRDCQRTVVVLSSVHENAVDCIGRKFSLISGYQTVEKLIEEGLKQLEMEKYVSI